jgi:hypothetical protein
VTVTSVALVQGALQADLATSDRVLQAQMDLQLPFVVGDALDEGERPCVPDLGESVE